MATSSGCKVLIRLHHSIVSTHNDCMVGLWLLYLLFRGTLNPVRWGSLGNATLTSGENESTLEVVHYRLQGLILSNQPEQNPTVARNRCSEAF
jgi:hypothetical protein